MTAARLLTLPILAVTLYAQTPTAPPQPIDGPGGSTHQFDQYVRFGPFYSTPDDRRASNSFYIYQPTGREVSSLPVIFFLHGELQGGEGKQQGDSATNYSFWFRQMALMGYTVVYPIWDGESPSEEYVHNIVNAYTASLTLLRSGAVRGLIPPSRDDRGLQVACAGHSLGGYLCFDLTQKLTTDPDPLSQPPRAIASFEIGTGGNLLNFDFSRIDPATYVVLVKGQADDGPNHDDGVADKVWESLKGDIPSTRRDFLEVINDDHGYPAQIGDHWYPMTNGFRDTAPVDDRDYNVVWKLSIGLFNCAFRGTDCVYGLGHGSYEQVTMGYWSDGVPVAPLAFVGR